MTGLVVASTAKSDGTADQVGKTTAASLVITTDGSSLQISGNTLTAGLPRISVPEDFVLGRGSDGLFAASPPDGVDSCARERFTLELVTDAIDATARPVRMSGRLTSTWALSSTEGSCAAVSARLARGSVFGQQLIDVTLTRA